MILFLFRYRWIRYTALAGLAALFLLGLYLLLRVRSGGARGTLSRPASPGAVLPKDDNEQIIVDPHLHTLIITRPTGTTVTHLPDHATVIDVRKDGTVGVTSPQWGLERRLFAGAYMSDKFRLALGMDGLYFKRLDFGIGVAGQLGISGHPPIGFAQVSYNVWSNCRIGIVYGTNRYVGGTLTVRL